MRYFLICFACLFLLSSPGLAAGPERATVLTLQDCLQRALQVNLSIVKQHYLEQAARYESSASFKDMLPALSTGYTYTGRRDAQTVKMFDRQVTVGGHDRYLWDLTMKMPIFYGGLLWNRYKRAELQVDLEKMALSQAMRDIVLQVKEQFFTILKNEKLVDESQAAVRRLEALVADTSGFYKAGLVPKTDLLQSKVELNRARLDLLKASHELELSRDRLNLILRQRPGTRLQIRALLEPLTAPLDLETMMENARDSRPEVLQARIALEQARRDRSIVRAELLPRLDLTAQYLKESNIPDLHRNPYGDNDQAQIMVTATWGIFSWGKRLDRLKAAETRIHVAETALQEVQDRVVFDVKSAYLLLTDALEGVKVARSALEHAREDYELTLARFKAQLASNTDTLDAQARLTAAKSSYYSALAASYIARARLEYATGKEPERCQRAVIKP